MARYGETCIALVSDRSRPRSVTWLAILCRGTEGLEITLPRPSSTLSFPKISYRQYLRMFKQHHYLGPLCALVMRLRGKLVSTYCALGSIFKASCTPLPLALTETLIHYHCYFLHFTNGSTMKAQKGEVTYPT